MNKSLLTNLVALLVTITGLIFDSHLLFMVGLFALSGALTNWLAIHMLFEKVPFLYGSGVVTQKFEEFKKGIHSLMMSEFFTKENLSRFFSSEVSSSNSHFDFQDLIQQTDFTPAYDSLKSAVMESSFGGMLGMFGGEKALEPLQEPFIEKMKVSINKIVHTEHFQKLLKEKFSSSDISDDIYDKVNLVVNNRLDELTPTMVKEIVEIMIKEHLGWLVIWGGVFGGLFGLLSTLFAV
ncbi:MAG: DUF445 domain-containing protein [Campylobacterales bacterium]|nr:DUF445 domain-containing protein [Campylobacterales bacterium]